MRHGQTLSLLRRTSIRWHLPKPTNASKSILKFSGDAFPVNRDVATFGAHTELGDRYGRIGVSPGRLAGRKALVIAGLPERVFAETMGSQQNHVAQIIRRHVHRKAATRDIVRQLNRANRARKGNELCETGRKTAR